MPEFNFLLEEGNQNNDNGAIYLKKVDYKESL